MAIQKTMARAISDSGAKMLYGLKYGDITPDIIWIRWLSYEPEFEKKRKLYLESKPLRDLTHEELQELIKYKDREEILQLFKIYGTKQITADQYVKVYEYMKKEDAETLMLDKLTKEELEYAKNEIKRLYTISNEELSEKVKNESKLDNYNSLSMTDSYILHIISKIIYSRSIKVTNQILKAEVESHRRMSEKSYYYANKNFYK